MKQEFLEKVKQFDASIFASYRNKQFAEVDERLHDLLLAAGDVGERLQVLDMCVNHYHFIEDVPRARQAIQERIALSPEQVGGWLGLAEHFHYHEEDLEAAAQNIDVALQKAVAQNQQVRQVLGVRIRIALERGDYPIVEDSLLKLLEFDLADGSIDVALESDFVSRIPPESVSSDILSRYKARLNLED